MSSRGADGHARATSVTERPLYREMAGCRACGRLALEVAFDLGVPCLSVFARTGEAVPAAPLVLVQCTGCGLVQLGHTVHRDVLYQDYWYRSGTNEAMVAALADVVREVLHWVRLVPGDVALDVGCNDGTLLRQYPRGVRRFGFDPALNLGTRTLPGDAEPLTVYTEFFPPSAGTWDAYLPELARAITSVAMFYDLDDPDAFVAAVREWLHPQGVWVVQFMDLDGMLESNAFDNICHEHLTYWSDGAFRALLARHELRVLGRSRNETNGGSVRYVVGHGRDEAADQVDALESIAATRMALRGLRAAADQQRRRVRWLLEGLRRRGRTVLGYGASTKGNTLLQYDWISPDLVPGIAERNPLKVGLVAPGSGIPIVSEEEMRARRPDYLLVLPWHFARVFRMREYAYLAAGGRMIVPLPTTRIMGADGFRGSGREGAGTLGSPLSARYTGR